MNKVQIFVRRLAPAYRGLIALAMVASLVGSGCGDPDEENPDDNNTCETRADCDPGYICGEDSTCVAENECEQDLNCPSGVCRDGVCVNPEGCQSNEECVSGTYCADDNTCQTDPCVDFECESGVCKRGTTECVSADNCTPATEDQDCIDGQRCVDGSCFDESGYCDALDCRRGECSYAEGGCVNPAEGCGGDDQACLEGFYCNDAEACAEDLCQANDVDCSGSGECVRALGECQNAETCESNDDCIDDHLCVEGTCTLEAMACGDPGCPGNQICDYDEDTLTTSCAEATHCQSAIGCTENRQCIGGACEEPLECQPDAFESNDSADEATDYAAELVSGGLDATICEGDSDFYTIDAADYTGSGTLVITAAYAISDAGLGRIDMELVDPDGNSVATADSGEAGMDGQAEIRTPAGDLAGGAYTIEVKDFGELSTAGVSYQFSVRRVSDTIAPTCADAVEITADESVSGSTADRASTEFGATCTPDNNDAPENIYTFELSEPTRVGLTATAVSTGLNISVSVRRACDRRSSEAACAGAGQSLTAVLPAGTYFAVVQAGTDVSGGEYDLDMTTTPVTCTSADDSCVDEEQARQCSDDGGGFSTVTCALGCAPRTGKCLVEPGDVCQQPKSAGANFSETISWGDYTNTYSIGSGGCIDGDNQTNGADVVYQVQVGPNEGLSATLDLPNGEFGAVYILDNCVDDDSEASCSTGDNASGDSPASGDGPGELSYTNETSQAQTLYVVADSAGGGQSEADLTIQIGEVICDPGDLTCDGEDGDALRCNAAGTGQVVDQACAFGCTGGACDTPPNDACTGAEALTIDEPTTVAIDSYADDLDIGETCTGSATDGADVFYTVTTTADDQIVTVDVDADFNASLYAVDACGASDCLAGIDDNVTTGAETLQFYAPTAGDYYVGVDSTESNPSGQLSITAQTQASECTPNERLGCSDTDAGMLEFCDALGVTEQYSCPSGACTGQTCDDPEGDACFDAIPVTAGAAYSGSFEGRQNNSNPDYSGRCNFSYAPAGDDVFYSVELTAGDILTANLSTTSDTAKVYVLDSCADTPTKSCNAGRFPYDSARFYAPEDGTYYVVVDNESASDAAFSLNLAVTTGGICQPNSISCDAANNELTRCGELGLTQTPAAACENGCSDGACNPPDQANSSCAVAYQLGGSTQIYDNWGNGFSDAYNPDACGVSGAGGPDAVYELDLSEGDVLTATLVAAPGPAVSLYIGTGPCSQIEDNCVAGKSPLSRVAQVMYTAQDDGPVYIFADTDFASYAGEFGLDVDIQTPTCTSGDSQCATANTVQTCNDDGVFEAESCGFGCANGECSPPPNEQCDGATPIPADGDWHSFYGQLDEYVGDYNLIRSDDSCTGDGADGSSPGPDVLYSVELDAGDKLEANWTTPDNASLWVTTACSTTEGEVENGCVAGNDDDADEAHLIYEADTAGTYYIVGDINGSTTSGSFEMKARAVTPECDPDSVAPMCLTDATTLKTCSDIGSLKEVTCPQGCDNGACIDDICEKPAINASVGGSFSGDLSNETNDYDLPSTACPGGIGYGMVGQDVAYAVAVSDGDQLHADLSSSSDLSLYIVTDCADLANSCVAGQDNTAGGGAEQITYDVDGDQMVHVVVDSYLLLTSSATYDLDITVQ